MTSWLIQMAQFDRRATSRLMKDMTKLKTTKERQQRLKVERERVAKFILKLQASIQRLEKKKQNAAIRLALKAEKDRLRRTVKYTEGVNKWRANPHEGTRK